MAPNWIVAEDNPPQPEPIADLRLFAVLGTWMEADVVGATVRNALTQGCERVYLVDNDSPDETVAVALEAGATFADYYATAIYDEHVKTTMLNATVIRISLQEESEHIWWLYVDADEFPHGPGGLTVRQYLERLDRRFRVVGSRVFNHFPTGTPQYVPGFHPLDFQPLCEEHKISMCPSWHWKHPLQRFDRHGPYLASSPGFHGVDRPRGPILEPATAVFTHHFQYREEAITRGRVQRFFDRADGTQRGALLDPEQDPLIRRWQTLDAAYAQKWDEIDSLRPDHRLGVQPRPWVEWVGTEDARVARWYTDAELTRALA